MTVFKGYMKIIQRNLAYMLAFFLIFAVISILTARFTENAGEQFFQPESVSITVVDQDNSALSLGVTTMLSQDNQVSPAKLNREALTEALYIRSTQYVLQIPENFEKDFSSEDVTLQVTAVPCSAAEYYLNNRIDSFLNQIRAWQAGGFSMEEAVEQALEQAAHSSKVTLLDTGETSLAGYAVSFQYLPYMYLSVLIYSVSYILKAFRSREIRLRMNASPVSPTRQLTSGTAAFLLLFLVFWGGSLLMPLLIGQGSFYTSNLFPWYLGNTLCLLISAASLAFFIGTLVQDDSAINALANSIGLGISFLCGIFVPLELLSDSVKQFSRFLPFYWYEVINRELGTHNALTAEIRGTVTQGFLIQAAFALAFFSLTLEVNRKASRHK